MWLLRIFEEKIFIGYVPTHFSNCVSRNDKLPIFAWPHHFCSLLCYWSVVIHLSTQWFPYNKFVLVNWSFWNFNTMNFWHRIKAKIDWGIVDLPMSKQEALRCQQVCLLFFVCEVFIVHLFLMRFSLTSSIGKSLAEKCNYYRFFLHKNWGKKLKF